MIKFILKREKVRINIVSSHLVYAYDIWVLWLWLSPEIHATTFYVVLPTVLGYCQPI